MKNKKIIALIVLLLLSGCSWGGEEKKTTTSSTTPKSVNEQGSGNIGEADSQSANVGGAVVLEESPLTFMDFNVEADKKNQEDAALTNADIEVINSANLAVSLEECEKVVDEARKSNCRDGVTLKMAVSDKNPSLCENIGFERGRDECEFAVSAN